MTKVKSKKAMRPKRKVSIKRPVVEDSLDVHAARAGHMYYDPCGADLVPTVYPGDRGYVNRFVSGWTAATAALETTAIIIHKPGVNVAFNIGDASAATAKLIGYSDTQAPGAAFLNSNATKARCTGYCINLKINAAPVDMTGQIYYGVIPASSVVEGASLSASTLVSLLTHSVAASQVGMQELEVKWSPGAFDDRYCPVSGVTGDDDTDRNVLVIVAVGLKAATGLHGRSTAIYEWTPTAASGATIDSTSIAPSRCDFSCVIRNLKRKDADWWWRLGSKVVKGARDVGLGYYTGGPIGAVNAFAKFA